MDFAIGLISTVIALGLLGIAVYKGVPILIASPICGAIVLLGNGYPLLEGLTGPYIAEAANFFKSWFLFFLLGAVLGVIMEQTGAAASLAHVISRKLGSKFAMPAVTAICGLLMIGGVSGFVVVFAVYPFAVELFKAADIPRKYMVATIAVSCAGWAMWLPGVPMTQNVIPMQYLGTTATACLFALVLLVFARPFLMAIGGDSQNIGFALGYCRITLVLGAVPTILSAALAHLIRATGNARIASLGITGGAVLNMALDPLFMFVLLPDGYEVVGAAAATTLSHTVCLCFFLLYVLKKNQSSILRFSLKGNPKGDSVLSDILHCGFPGFCLVAMGQVSNFFLNGMLASLGASNAVAAIGIVRRIDSLAYSFNQGITQGMLPIAAFCFSSRRYGRMKRVIAFSAACTMSFSLVCSFLSYVYAPQLIELFIRDDATIAYGVQFLRILCIAVAIYPLLFVIIASFQAAGQSVRPFILSLLHRGTFDIALFFLIRRIWGLDYVLWASPIMAAVALLTSILLYTRFLRSLNQSHTFESPR